MTCNLFIYKFAANEGNKLDQDSQASQATEKKRKRKGRKCKEKSVSLNWNQTRMEVGVNVKRCKT